MSCGSEEVARTRAGRRGRVASARTTEARRRPRARGARGRVGPRARRFRRASRSRSVVRVRGKTRTVGRRARRERAPRGLERTTLASRSAASIGRGVFARPGGRIRARRVRRGGVRVSERRLGRARTSHLVRWRRSVSPARRRRTRARGPARGARCAAWARRARCWCQRCTCLALSWVGVSDTAVRLVRVGAEWTQLTSTRVENVETRRRNVRCRGARRGPRASGFGKKVGASEPSIDPQFSSQEVPDRPKKNTNRRATSHDTRDVADSRDRVRSGRSSDRLRSDISFVCVSRGWRGG